MRQSSASAARVSFSPLRKLAPERMRLQRVVAKAPGLGVPSLRGGELKNQNSTEVHLVDKAKASMGRSLSARRSFVIARRSVRHPDCQIPRGSGTSRLQPSRHHVVCRSLVGKRSRLPRGLGGFAEGLPNGQGLVDFGRNVQTLYS